MNIKKAMQKIKKANNDQELEKTIEKILAESKRDGVIEGIKQISLILENGK